MRYFEFQAVLLWLPALTLGIVCLSLWRRRIELSASARNYRELSIAKERGSHAARLVHPEIDLSRCIGCGLCVQACPEDGVLEMIHGQAVVVHGARCVGHGRCAAACPTSGIALTLGDLSNRRDLPALTEEFEAVGTPGLFLAGEITGFALVRTAIAQGTAVANVAATRIGAALKSRSMSSQPIGVLDLAIVGAGPGGLACALRGKELGLRLGVFEQEERLGGTVAGYPRRKLVMTQPVELPLFGRLPKLIYQKEELIELWERVARDNALPIKTGQTLTGIEREGNGLFRVETNGGVTLARNVCIAIGRRGSPRKLGVPGENRTNVAYSLLDVKSYQGRRILIVGGGDTAIEAAVGLSLQPGNEVSISYRKNAFFRLKSRNEKAIQKAIVEKRVRAIFESEVKSIEDGHVVLDLSGTPQSIANDDVFIFAGGTPPFELLEKSGVSFNPEDRPLPAELADKGTGLLAALTLAFLSTLVMCGWALWNWDYYRLDVDVRAGSALHKALRPSGQLGLAFGVVACTLFICNLTYLCKRSLRFGRFLPGTLRFWMGSHVFTGIFALLCVLVHAGFTFKNAAGGHALLGLAAVVLTGSVGRYLYAFVPRAANGAELDLDDVRSQLASLSGEWDRQGRGFGESVRKQIDDLITSSRWRPGLATRIVFILRGQFTLRRNLQSLHSEGRTQGIAETEIRQVIKLARRSYRLTLQVAHYEEVRAILSSWRYFHRWLALLMIILAVLHIVTAIRFADLDWQSLMFWRSVRQ
jgi:thioredoxin reductase/NAD-dependent dihydropyrimidine dehydrogenase PreA subunit